MTVGEDAIQRKLVHADWLKEASLVRLLSVLNRDGENARVIGGAVRNALLEQEPGEIDIATTATPEEVMRRANAEGFKAVPTGIEHGTVTVIVAGKPFEVTTLREDVETFGRKATVRFGRDWPADAARRDFTINALSVSPDGTVYDYVGGLADLNEQRVRFIGDPAIRIAEDYLRILRFFRFHAAYGRGLPDPAGLHAAIAARKGLERLSRERVRMELLKLLLAAHAVPTLAVMAEVGLLDRVLGGVPYLASLSNLIKTEAASGTGRDAIRRLAALAVWVSEDADRLGNRLRLSNEEHERLMSIGDGWWRIDARADAQARRAILYRLGPQRFTDRALIAWARSEAGAADAAWRELAALPKNWPVPSFPLKAADFMDHGVGKGPQLGATLRRAEEAWIAADFPTAETALREIIELSLPGRRPQ